MYIYFEREIEGEIEGERERERERERVVFMHGDMCTCI